MMRMEVPPKAWMRVFDVNVNRIDGATAITARKSAPGRVMWSRTPLM